MSCGDLELQNLLRSNKTHKLGTLYFTLLNIPPQYRSQLQNIIFIGSCKNERFEAFWIRTNSP